MQYHAIEDVKNIFVQLESFQFF